MRNQWLKPVLLLGLSLNLSSAFAADQHAGDIQPWLENGQIQLNANLFEADFGDLSGGLYRTDDPGFDANTTLGAFGAGNWLWFQGLNSLKFWDGASWSNSVPNGEHIQIDDALGNTSVFTTSGTTNPAGVIGEFDTFGDIHEHLDMSIYNASNSLGGTVGAYWITLQLFETLPETPAALRSSASFDIIFNRGLNTVAFEAAVAQAAVSSVPLPATVWMFVSALMGWLSLGRRRGSFNG